METILDIDDKKIFIYNILHNYSTNSKLINDILQIIDKYNIVHTENINGIFLNLSKISDIDIINEIFLIVQSFNYTQNIIVENDNIIQSYKKPIEMVYNDDKILVNHKEYKLLEFFKNI